MGQAKTLAWGYELTSQCPYSQSEARTPSLNTSSYISGPYTQRREEARSRQPGSSEHRSHQHLKTKTQKKYLIRIGNLGRSGAASTAGMVVGLVWECPTAILYFCKFLLSQNMKGKNIFKKNVMRRGGYKYHIDVHICGYA